jgi:hypothetical protein
MVIDRPLRIAEGDAALRGFREGLGNVGGQARIVIA